MDKKKGFKNVIVSVVFRVLLLVATLLTRRFLIQFVGNDVNGLNSLYTSILGFLAVAELGVGSAITFCMYKPIVEGDDKKVAALYCLFKRLYLIIGGIILLGGCVLMPFLKFFAKDYAELDVDLYLTFALSLAAVLITYLFSAKTSLLNAYKNNYISTAITSSGQLLACGLQILVLFLTRSFVWYLVCAIAAALAQWAVTEIVTRKMYGGILALKEKIDPETKGEVVKNVKAMFMHKIGGVLVNTADSVIISAFLGVALLGKYSNYIVIASALSSTIALCFTPLTSIIGHLYVEESGESLRKYLHFFHTFNFVLGAIFFLGYYAIIDDLVTIFFDSAMTGGLLFGRWVTFVITLNYFIQFMRQATMLFRDATGTFYYDRYKPLVEGTVNIALSIAFVYLFGLIDEEFSVVGVIAATILTNLFICHIVEPHVLYKHAIHYTPKYYYIKNYFYIALFAAALVGLHFCHVSMESRFNELLVNGCIAVAVSLVPILIAVLTDGDFRHHVKALRERFRQKHRKPIKED